MAVGNPFSTVVKVLCAQVLMSMLVASGFLMIGGWKHVLSPLLGGGVAILPNAYLAGKVYLARYKAPQDVLNAFYAGEAVKLLLTVVLFSVVLQLPSVDFLALFVGYVAALSVFWFALFYWRD